MQAIINTVPDLIELAKRIKSATEPIAVDTETNGLFPIEDKVVGWSLAFSEEEGYYIPANHRVTPNVPGEQIKQLFTLLKDKLLIWHNGKFDIEMIKCNYNLEMPVYADTIVMAYLACFPKLALKEIMKSYFGYDTKEFNELLSEKYGKTWKAKGYTAADLEAQDISDYAIHDVLYTYKLFNTLKSQMESCKSIYKLELNLVPIIAEMNLSGIDIDCEKMLTMARQARGELDARFNKMQELINKEVEKTLLNESTLRSIGLWDENFVANVAPLKEFKPASPKQVKTVLFDLYHLEVLKRTDKGAPSTDGEVLAVYAEQGNEFAKALTEYRTLYKYVTSYLEKIPEICSHTGKLYASFNAVGAESGRFTCPGSQNWEGEDRTVNLQNQPVDEVYDVRSCYIAPEGWTWVKADYKQQEYRAMCNIAGEQGAIQKFRDGVDFHTATARMMLGIPDNVELTRDQRQLGKKLNFGVSYGMSVATIAKDIDRTPGEAQQLYDKYFEGLPHIKQLINWAYHQVETTEMIKTYFGRVRKLKWRDEPSRRADRIKNSGFNTMIQGTSADITKIAILRVKDRVLDRFGTEKVQMKLQVHDELDFIVKNEYLDEICAEIKAAMTIPTPETWVDFEVDLEVGHSWSESEHEDWLGEWTVDKFEGWNKIIPEKYQSYLTVPNYSATW